MLGATEGCGVLQEEWGHQLVIRTCFYSSCWVLVFEGFGAGEGDCLFCKLSEEISKDFRALEIHFSCFLILKKYLFY